MFEALLSVVLLAAEGQDRAVKPRLVGQFFICGNAITPASLILHDLTLYPGTVLTNADLKENRARLKSQQILGIKASISILNPDPKYADNPYKDILVEIDETLMTHILVGPMVAVQDAIAREQLRRMRTLSDP